ncbi:MAG: tetratricopeptide repeat protein, partial [Bacteroidota bacterium]
MGILKKTLILALVLVATQLVHAQPTLSKADKQYDLHAYNLAIKSYLRVLERQPNNIDALSKLADCYFFLNRMEEAQTYYERAIKTGKASPFVHFQYGQTLKSIGQYDLAKAEFLKYASSYPIDGNQFAESCDFATARLNAPSQFSVRGEYVNTTAADFGPTFYQDYVVFASSRIDMKRQSELNQTATWTGSAKNQLFISTRDENQYLTQPNFLRSDLNNHYGEGPIAYSPDGRYVAITKNNFADGTRQLPQTGIEMSIYLAEVSLNGDWEDPIPFPHNGPGFSNGYP